MNDQQEQNLLLIDGFHETYHVRLDKFDGPLDLLLHLIKKNELDIYDIPIADITRQYLEYIRLMKDLNLDVAGDFLLMASTLLQIKSALLLPRDEENLGDEEEPDPRAELIRRLLEYQQYKEAGQLLGARALLGRELFVRSYPEAELLAEHQDEGPLDVELFDLVEAFRSLLARIPVETFHEVAAADSLSIADSINEILALLQEREMVEFDDLVMDDFTRERVIVSFLALLELCRLRMIRIFQNTHQGGIRFVPAVVEETVDNSVAVISAE
ncbi:MAG: segregation/condensation protein A [Desulfuromonadales bacterium]|nr:segregation/condensation protein A [Desulfuromonadales bacterium]